MLVVTDDERLLVLRGHDPHDPDRSWWFVPGGGLEGDEGPLEAARRELAEETGIECAAEHLVGPVWDRTAFFDFMSRPYVQHEVFYVLRVTAASAPGLTAWTASEEETIDEVRWMTQPELRDAPIEVFPAQLREPWAPFLQWQGTVIELGEVQE